MDKIFLVHNGSEYTTKKLLDDLNLMNSFSPLLYVENNNPYEIFLSIIHSLLYDYSIEILDGDFSENELKDIGINKPSLLIRNKIETLVKINDFDTLLGKIRGAEKWSLSLYTSGTTGRPKKVSHSFHSLTRNVKIQDKFYEDVWAFAYNPTHMAGLQVFFQALLNQNTIIYTFDLHPREIPKLIKKYHITNISATSTYYRNMMPFLINDTYESVKRITFGGEKFDPNLEDKVKTVFPNAKIRNIYASTEGGSVFSAQGDIFEINESMSDQVKISANNELFIHYSLLGKSDALSLQSEWYNTGDLVEFVGSHHFRITSRKTAMINVGGYKVNPLEVEETLLKIPGIIDVLVKAKENKVTGQIVVADIIKDKDLDESELKKSIKHYASFHLQEWKVPRIIKFVSEIPRTRTGKKVRK